MLAVEVLSPSDSFRQVSNKIKMYLDGGVKVVWLVDSDEETISVYRPNEQWKVFAANQQLAGDPELPGFSHRVSDFFLLPGELPESCSSSFNSSFSSCRRLLYSAAYRR